MLRLGPVGSRRVPSQDSQRAAAIMATRSAIISSIPQDEMARFTGVHPAIHEHTRPCGTGPRHAGGRPPQVFEGLWGLAASVLTSADQSGLSTRLGIV